MYYTRTYEKKLKEVCKFFPVVLLTGARQSGKTTLLKKTFPDYSYISLDLPSIAEQAENNPLEFFSTYKAPMIIDEVQYAPGLFRHLKKIVDEKRHSMGEYILTGSQKFSLMKGVSDSLAGRSVLLELENLSWYEINKTKPRNFNYSELILAMVRGQFPELWRVPDFPVYSFYSSYISTYLERDVRQILNIVSLRDFERFLRALAPRSGQLLNKTEIARDVGVSVKAINDWISVLEASNQIVLLEPWYSNISKRIVKSPKVYFCDSGLLCFLLNVNDSSLSSSPFRGQIWETAVFSELRKINQASSNPFAFWFYRDQLAREIDFVLERAGQLYFIECKWNQNPKISDAKTIKTVHNELSDKKGIIKPGKHYIISTAETSYNLEANIKVVGGNDFSDIINTDQGVKRWSK
jgi:uncharacterized protein